MSSILLILLALTSQAQAQRPNIVMVLVDDLDNVATRPYLEQVLPRTMALRGEGLELPSAMITTPQCCPSRAAILSGKYGHNTRVLGNGGRNGGYENFIDNEPGTIAAELYRAGYRTLMAGKYLNGFHNDDAPPFGWTDGQVLTSPRLKKYKGYDYDVLQWRDGKAASARPGETRWLARPRVKRHGDSEVDYSTDVVAARTLEFLADAKHRDDARPFFAFVTPTCPHFPLPPAKRHLAEAAARFGWGTFPTNRPNYFSDGATVNDKPQWLRESWGKRSRLLNYGGKILSFFGAELPPDAPSGRLGWNEVDWFNRMGSLMACDELVDGLVTWLKANDEWDNTIFVFTSDNGYNLGAHALVQKSAPYEESLRVPLIIAGGASTGLRRGVVEREWHLNIDHAPTFLGLAGLPIPADMDGENLAPLLRGEGVYAPRRQSLVEYSGPSIAEGYIEDFLRYHLKAAPAFFMDVPTYQAVRSRREGREYLYVRWERPLTDPMFQRRLRKERRLLRARIERGRPLALRRLKRALAKDLELYDLTADPHQLTNLLYVSGDEPDAPLGANPPARYRALVQELDALADELVACKGSGGAKSCVRAARAQVGK
ncbi:MAG: sulfatase-like hydrolase/transferase [Bdellovibrionales bacterium]|nr:sulfatase-like hydrolase/transferase [Bdellovibrionales bacterium]